MHFVQRPYRYLKYPKETQYHVLKENRKFYT